MANKGSPFEREMSRAFSLWWTAGKEDDVFWRTQGSGGRATSRRKKQKTTRGQEGDLTNTQPHGKPLIDCFTIECKRGYPKANVHHHLDRKREVVGELEKMIHQAYQAHRAAGSLSWLLVHRRDGKIAYVWMPHDIAQQLKVPFVAWDYLPQCIVQLSVYGRNMCLRGMPLEVFFESFDPARIITLTRKKRHADRT